MNLALVWLLLAAAGSVASAEEESVPDGTIFGHVYDANTKQPLSQAFVYTQDVKCLKPATNSEGYYALKGCFSPLKNYAIECRKNGYESSSQSITTDQRGTAEYNLYLFKTSPKWSKTYGGKERDWGNSVKEIADNGYIICGDTFSYGEEPPNFWLVKTDSEGNEIWNRTFDNYGFEEIAAHGVLPTTDGGYIIAGTTGSTENSDIWIIKTDSSGVQTWDKTIGGPNFERAGSIKQTSDEGFIIAGQREQTTPDFNSDFLLLKIDSKGDLQWERSFDKSTYDVCSDVQETTDHGYIVLGQTGGPEDIWLIKTDLNGNKIWDKTFGGSDHDSGNSIQKTSDAGYIITGMTLSYGAGNFDAWLIKIDSYGNKMWDKTFGGQGDDRGSEVRETNDSGYIIAGVTEKTDNWDIWLIKNDKVGDKIWDKTFGGPQLDYGNSVQETSDGGYIVAGQTGSYGAGYVDMVLIKTDSNGDSNLGELSKNKLIDLSEPVPL